MGNFDNLIVTRYKPELNLSGFSCGNQSIDFLLKNHVSILEEQGRASTNLFYLEDELVGFCTLLADRISKSNTEVFLQGEFPSYYPAIQLYSLGVDKSHQSSGLGSIILEWVIGTAFNMRKQIGVTFIVLESYNDERLLQFYTKNGFNKWSYLHNNDGELIPLVYDFRGLDGII